MRLIWDGRWPVPTLVFEPRAVWGQGFSLWCFPDGRKGHSTGLGVLGLRPSASSALPSLSSMLLCSVPLALPLGLQVQGHACWGGWGLGGSSLAFKLAACLSPGFLLWPHPPAPHLLVLLSLKLPWWLG